MTETKLPDCVPYEQKMQQEKMEDEEAKRIEELLEGLSDEEEDRLETYHAENCADGVLDDELYDSYQDWLMTLTREEIIEILF